MENLKIDDFKQYSFLSEIKFSKNGKASAVKVSMANDKNSYNSSIYVDKGSGYFKLTNEKGKIGSYIWLDDENILFSETRDKDTKAKIDKGYKITSFYKININGGEAQLVFQIKANVKDISLLDSKNFLLCVDYDNAYPELEGKSEEEIAKILKDYKKEKDYQVVDELPYWFNGKGFINKKRQRLYKYNKDGELLPLTGPLDDVSEYKISPCKKYILFSGYKAPFEIKDIKTNLYLLNLENITIEKVLKQDLIIKTFDFYNDKIFLAASTGEKYAFSEHPNFYIVEKNGDIQNMHSYPLSICSSANTDVALGSGTTAKFIDNAFYFTSLNNYTTDIYKFCLNKCTVENITNWDANIHFFDIFDDKIIFCGMKDLELQELYSIKNGKINKISQFNSEALLNKSLSAPMCFSFKDKDDYKIDGWVMQPIGYNSNKKYPAILNIHGGPKTAYSNCFFHEMQYWANKGYFVIFCNPRGSDGKGNVFADIRGKYGTVDYDNIMQFVEEACELYPNIDKHKLGVTGGSYGGFMTNWIIGHSNKFAAAATQRSISNWVSFSYVSDIGYFFGSDQIQANPWENLEQMWKQSPLKYAPNVKTPTLIIHSNEDYRCWIPEAYQFFTALKLNGIETRMYIFKDENHDLSRTGKPEARVHRIKEITDWMDRFLK